MGCSSPSPSSISPPFFLLSWVGLRPAWLNTWTQLEGGGGWPVVTLHSALWMGLASHSGPQTGQEQPEHLEPGVRRAAGKSHWCPAPGPSEGGRSVTAKTHRGCVLLGPCCQWQLLEHHCTVYCTLQVSTCRTVSPGARALVATRCLPLVAEVTILKGAQWGLCEGQWLLWCSLLQ